VIVPKQELPPPKIDVIVPSQKQPTIEVSMPEIKPRIEVNVPETKSITPQIVVEIPETETEIIRDKDGLIKKTIKRKK
jgi:hypothetical protein